MTDREKFELQINLLERMERQMIFLSDRDSVERLVKLTKYSIERDLRFLKECGKENWSEFDD